MRIEYAFGLEDHLAFTEHHYRRSRSARRRIRFRRFGTPVLAVATVILLAATFDREAVLDYAARGLLVGALWVLIFPFYHRLLVRRSVRRFQSQAANRRFFGTQSLALEPEGLVHEGGFGEFRVHRGAIGKVERDTGHAFIYISDEQAFVIPRAKVAEGDFEAFLDAVERARDGAPRGND